jgi:hypothetical protein
LTENEFGSFRACAGRDEFPGGLERDLFRLKRILRW